MEKLFHIGRCFIVGRAVGEILRLMRGKNITHITDRSVRHDWLYVHVLQVPNLQTEHFCSNSKKKQKPIQAQTKSSSVHHFWSIKSTYFYLFFSPKGFLFDSFKCILAMFVLPVCLFNQHWWHVIDACDKYQWKLMLNPGWPLCPLLFSVQAVISDWQDQWVPATTLPQFKIFITTVLILDMNMNWLGGMWGFTWLTQLLTLTFYIR